MRSLFPFLLLAALVGCATHEERQRKVTFVMDTPVGQVTGVVHDDETTNRKSGIDEGAAGDLLGKAASIAGTFAPWAGAAGLALAAFLKHRQARKAEDERAVAEKERETATEAVVRTTKAISRFEDEDDAPAKRLKQLLSQEMDKVHKDLVREVKP
jgi:hypothetical protein